MTNCTASWEPSDVSFQSNKDLKIGGDYFQRFQRPKKVFVVNVFRFLE